MRLAIIAILAILLVPTAVAEPEILARQQLLRRTLADLLDVVDPSEPFSVPPVPGVDVPPIPPLPPVGSLPPVPPVPPVEGVSESLRDVRSRCMGMADSPFPLGDETASLCRQWLP